LVLIEPIFKIQHFSTEIVNCQVAAQSDNVSRADCNLIMSASFTTLGYNLTSSANSFTFMPWFSKKIENQLVESVTKFTYLGSDVVSGSSSTPEVLRRIGLANSIVGQ